MYVSLCETLPLLQCVGALPGLLVVQHTDKALIWEGAGDCVCMCMWGGGLLAIYLCA